MNDSIIHTDPQGRKYKIGYERKPGVKLLVPVCIYLDAEECDTSRHNQPPLLCNTGVKSVLSSTDEVLHDGPVLLESGLDYLSLTATNIEGAEQLEIVASEMAPKLIADGELVKERRELRGMYQGFAVGRHFFYGTGREGAYLRASSSLAGGAFKWLQRFNNWHFGASRIDFQATVKHPQELPQRFFWDVADKSYEASQNISGRRSRPWHTDLSYHYGRGDTVYLGTMKSPSFARCYDKGHEDPKHYEPGSVRYEVVLHSKKKMVTETLHRLLQLELAGNDVGKFTQEYVASYFRQRGVDVPYGAETVDLARVPARTSDIERTTEWLEKGVQPSVLRLLGAGLTKEQVLKVLGLE